MRHDFGHEIRGMGINNSGYPGGFTPVVLSLISLVICRVCNRIGHRPKILHLFSGSSTIGDIRVDLKCRQATNRQDVLSFIRYNRQIWDLVILDPPYGIERRNKLDEYAKTSSVAADVILRRELEEFFRNHAGDVLWLDGCVPLPKPFYRVYIWILFPGGYRPPRYLNWIRNEKRLYRKEKSWLKCPKRNG